MAEMFLYEHAFIRTCTNIQLTKSETKDEFGTACFVLCQKTAPATNSNSKWPRKTGLK